MRVRVGNVADGTSSGDVYVGRGTPLGNPYTHIKDRKTRAEFTVATRRDSLDAYRAWLDDRLTEGGEVARTFDGLVDRLRSGETLTLLCHCAPKPCHADIIKTRLLEHAFGGGLDWLDSESDASRRVRSDPPAGEDCGC